MDNGKGGANPVVLSQRFQQAPLAFHKSHSSQVAPCSSNILHVEVPKVPEPPEQRFIVCIDFFSFSAVPREVMFRSPEVGNEPRLSGQRLRKFPNPKFQSEVFHVNDPASKVRSQVTELGKVSEVQRSSQTELRRPKISVCDFQVDFGLDLVPNRSHPKSSSQVAKLET